MIAKFKNIGATDRTSLVIFETNDATPVDWNAGVGGAGNGLGLGSGQFYVEQVGHGARMVIDNTGRVGIGTNTPSAKLNFGTLVGDSVFLFGATNNKYGLGIRASELRVFYGTDLPTDHTSFGNRDGTTFTEFMRLNNQGQVSINTTTPRPP